MESYSVGDGWILTIASSLLCVCGCMTVFIDDLYRILLPSCVTRRYPFKLQNNYNFSNGALAFSSGCLIFMSLYKMLPKAYAYLEKSNKDGEKKSEKLLNTYLFVSFFGGIFVCMNLNFILYIATSSSIIHCSHREDHDVPHSEHGSDYHTHLNSGEHDISPVTSTACCRNHNHAADGNISMAHSSEETTPLVHDRPKLKKSKSLLHYLNLAKKDKDYVGECKGYSSAELCLYNNHHSRNGIHYCEIPKLDNSTSSEHIFDGSSVHSYAEADHEDSPSEHISHPEDHHHHIQTPLSRLLLIGIQTTLAITLHKFPEGFITYVTGQTDKKLGFQIFLSLAAHNFTEGFLMCFPLYFSQASVSRMHAKIKAFAVSGLLGGLSQPLGALFGHFFLKYNGGDGNFQMSDMYQVFGITFAVTSGFLLYVALSMFGSATLFAGGNLNFVLYWCLAGIAVLSFSTTLTSS